MRRILALVFSVLLAPVVVVSGEMSVKYRVALSEGGAGLVRGLTFHAPFTDPANSLTLYKGTGTLSDTRNTTSTYVHATTDLVTVASANTGRIEDNGVLVEGQRVNKITYSNVFDNTDGWAFWGAASVTPGITSPAGDNTAYQLDMPAASTGIHHIDYTDVSGLPLSFAIYIKADENGTIRVFDGGGNFTNDITASVTTEWQRFYTTGTRATPGACQFGVYRNSAGQLAKVYIYGSQMEEGASSSSYIPTTTAAVTRNADVLSIASSGNIDNVDGTLAFSWSPNFASTDNVVTVVLFDAGIKATYTSSDRKINFTDGTNTISTDALTFPKGVVHRLAFRWGPGGLDIYRNGASAATGATYTAFVPNANLHIGSDVSSANQAFSNFKDVRALNREPTDAEMVAATQ